MTSERGWKKIRAEEAAVFQQKQTAWFAYDKAKVRVRMMYEEMMEAWEKRCNAMRKMTREYKRLQDLNAQRNEAWNEFNRIRAYNTSRISSLRDEATMEHQDMLRCFGQAHFEYHRGSKALAKTFSEAGHEHESRRNELNAEVAKLIQEIKAAREKAKGMPKADPSMYKFLKSTFEELKKDHELARAEFKKAQAERDRAKADFDSLQAKYLCIMEEIRRRSR